MSIQWPSAAVSSDDDLGSPAAAFLVKLNLLEKDGELDQVGLFRTPPSLQVITAGGTALSKGSAAAVASLGGGAAVWAVVKGFWTTQPGDQWLAYIGAAALTIAAVVIALALIVRADVQARASATAAQYAARAETAVAFLQTTQQIAAQHYVIQRNGTNIWLDVKSFEEDPARGVVAVIDGDRVPLQEISGIARLVN
ncbi:MAG: hypothetical protein ACM32E_08830 [Gemmatimonadota bacterium]